VSISTDNLRAIADDLDDADEALEAFVLVAVTADGTGQVVRIMSSSQDKAASAMVLGRAVDMLRGGALQ